jgi:hypothetical protein
MGTLALSSEVASSMRASKAFSISSALRDNILKIIYKNPVVEMIYNNKIFRSDQ